MSRLIYNAWLYRTNKPKKSKRKTRKGKSRILKHAEELNKNVPRSEIWFRELIEKETLGISFDYNVPKHGYIMDAFNKEYNICVEVDGTWHDRDDQKIKDIKKDFRLKCQNIKVIRIKAYNTNSYNAAIDEIKTILNVKKFNIT